MQRLSILLFLKPVYCVYCKFIEWNPQEKKKNNLMTHIFAAVLVTNMCFILSIFKINFIRKDSMNTFSKIIFHIQHFLLNNQYSYKKLI